LDKVDTAMLVFVSLLGNVIMASKFKNDTFAIWSKTVQMDQMNPPPLVVHLLAPVIQTFVFQLVWSFSRDKIVDTASMGGWVGGAATVASVSRWWMSVMVVDKIVQMDQMNPSQLAVHLPAQVIQTFVFQLGLIFYLNKTFHGGVLLMLRKKKTAETALLRDPMRILVGAATVASVSRRRMFVMVVEEIVQMDQMNLPPLVVLPPAPVIQTSVFKLGTSFCLDKTVETAMLALSLIGAATVDSVC